MKKTLNIIQLILLGIVAISMFIPGMFQYERWESFYLEDSIAGIRGWKEVLSVPISLFWILCNSSNILIKIFICLFILILLVNVIGFVIAIYDENSSIACIFIKNKIIPAICSFMFLFMCVLSSLDVIKVDRGINVYYYYVATSFCWLISILLIVFFIIDIYKRSSKCANAPVTVKTNVVQVNSNADELKKYKDLLDNGVITQEEFEAKKKQLLGL